MKASLRLEREIQSAQTANAANTTASVSRSQAQERSE